MTRAAKIKSDGSTASYYELPESAKTIDDLVTYKEMNLYIESIFITCFEYGRKNRGAELPEGATELQHIISHANMNAQIGEIFRACYRYGEVAHSEKLRDAKKIKFYAEAEVERLKNTESPWVSMGDAKMLAAYANAEIDKLERYEQSK